MEFTVGSGPAYIISLAAVIGYALYSKAAFNEFWIAIASLYGWHTGRRLWRQLKMGAIEANCDEGTASGEK